VGSHMTINITIKIVIERKYYKG